MKAVQPVDYPIRLAPPADPERWKVLPWRPTFNWWRLYAFVMCLMSGALVILISVFPLIAWVVFTSAALAVLVVLGLLAGVFIADRRPSPLNDLMKEEWL